MAMSSPTRTLPVGSFRVAGDTPVRPIHPGPRPRTSSVFAERRRVFWWFAFIARRYLHNPNDRAAVNMKTGSSPIASMSRYCPMLSQRSWSRWSARKGIAVAAVRGNSVPDVIAPMRSRINLIAFRASASSFMRASSIASPRTRFRLS